jgi:hypothetical protein
LTVAFGAVRGAKTSGVLLALVAGLVAAGCGSSSGGSSTTSSSNGVAAKSPDQILQAAVNAAESAKSMHVSGTVQQGGKLGLDLDLVTGKGAAGTISQGPEKFKLVVTGGNFYFQGNRAFWLKVGHSEAAVKLFLGKWIKEPSAAGQFASVSHLTSIKSLMNGVLKQHGSLTKGSTTTVAGQSAVAVHDAKNGTLYVATTGKPYPLKVTGSKASSGAITFDQYNHTFTIAAPKQSVNAKQLQQGGA